MSVPEISGSNPTPKPIITSQGIHEDPISEIAAPIIHDTKVSSNRTFTASKELPPAVKWTALKVIAVIAASIFGIVAGGIILYIHFAKQINASKLNLSETESAQETVKPNSLEDTIKFLNQSGSAQENYFAAENEDITNGFDGIERSFSTIQNRSEKNALVIEGDSNLKTSEELEGALKSFFSEQKENSLSDPFTVAKFFLGTSIFQPVSSSDIGKLIAENTLVESSQARGSRIELRKEDNKILIDCDSFLEIKSVPAFEHMGYTKVHQEIVIFPPEERAHELGCRVEIKRTFEKAN